MGKITGVNIFDQHGLFCPLTLGRRTAMSEDAWAKVCAAARKPRSFFRGGNPPAPSKICGLCRGKHRPEELEIIDMTKIGECEACGEKKQLKNNRNKMICSSCVALYGAVANRPELALSVLRELRPALLDEPAAVCTDELERQLHEAQGRADQAETAVEMLGNEYRGLQEELATAKRLLQEHQATKVGGASTDSALLDLALDALRGDITGLKPERIEALRRM